MKRVSLAVAGPLLLSTVLLGLVRPAHGGSLPVVAVHAATKNEPGHLTFLDPDTLAIVGRSSITASPWPICFDRSGTVLYVFGTTGLIPLSMPSKKPWSLWSVDPGAGTSTPLGELGRGPLRAFTDDLPSRLYVVGTDRTAKVTPILLSDLGAAGPVGPIARVQHLSFLALSPDGALLYALCQGKKHTKPKGPPGNLHVLDAATGTEIARLDVGSGAWAVASDPGRGLAYVLGAGERVTVLRGAALAGQLTVPGRALALASGPDGTNYLLVEGGVVALASDGLSPARTWRVGFHPFHLLFDTARGRLFAGARGGSKIAELDLGGEGVLVEHPMGNPAVKAGKGMGLGAMAFFMFGATFMTGVPMVPVGLFSWNPMSMALGPDGRYLYVLRPFTNDITLFDTTQRDVVGFVPTGGGSLRIVRVPDDPNMWIESRGALERLDTVANRIDRTVKLGHSIHPARVAYDLDRGRAWTLEGSAVRVWDLRTGEIVGTVELPSQAFGIWAADRRPG